MNDVVMDSECMKVVSEAVVVPGAEESNHSCIDRRRYPNIFEIILSFMILKSKKCVLVDESESHICINVQKYLKSFLPI